MSSTPEFPRAVEDERFVTEAEAKSPKLPVRRGNPRGCIFFQVPAWIGRRTELTATAKLVYGHLVRRYNEQLKFAFCGTHDIARNVGVGERQVRRCLRELVSFGLVFVEKRRVRITSSQRRSGRRRTFPVQTIYTFPARHKWLKPTDRSFGRAESEAFEELQAQLDDE